VASLRSSDPNLVIVCVHGCVCVCVCFGGVFRLLKT
jgi:hypothetical protein